MKHVTDKTEAERRKATPVYSGVLSYFPRALRVIAQCSKAGNDQHNTGQPLHWNRAKSQDELDALTRHLLDHAQGVAVDTDGISHLTKVAWRALAMLEKACEAAEAPAAIKPAELPPLSAPAPNGRDSGYELASLFIPGETVSGRGAHSRLWRTGSFVGHRGAKESELSTPGGGSWFVERETLTRGASE
jgi:hypothetical protein